MLGSGQIGAVDNPVIVTAAVEIILLPQTVGKHLPSVILLPRDRVGRFLFDGCIQCRRHLAFLCIGDATPLVTTKLALLVGGFIMVHKLEVFVVGAGDGVGSCRVLLWTYFLSSQCASLLRPWKNSAARAVPQSLLPGIWLSCLLQPKQTWLLGHKVLGHKVCQRQSWHQPGGTRGNYRMI